MSRSTITPHASHRMGIVRGEVCCVNRHDGEICGAAPWMPLIERPCGDDSDDDTTERNAAITKAYTDGMMIKDIAREYGLDRSTVSRILGTRAPTGQKGQRGRGPIITIEDVREAIRLRAEGLTWPMVGQRMGRPQNSIKEAANDAQRGRRFVGEVIDATEAP